jgi:ubiquinone/menaquinone biosynthesis C-methylase UbiE
MNDFMSAGTHRLWKDEFVNMVGPLRASSRQQQPLALLDVAGGTGDIAFRLFEKLRNSSPPLPNDKRPSITVFDINDAMLEVGKERAVNLGYLPPTAEAEAASAVDGE